MHVTGFWTAVGFAITGLIIADVLYHGAAANSLARTTGRFSLRESRILAGRG